MDTPQTPTYIVIDAREHELIKFFPNVKTANLPVGDIWIGLKEGEEQNILTQPLTLMSGGIVLERKSIADMESSMSDGRYREQRTRLQAFAVEHKCHIAYVFEGSLQKAYRYSKQILLKWLVRLPFVHKIPYFQTNSIEDTAEFVRTLAAKWKDDAKDFEEGINPQGKTTEYTSTIKNHTKGEQRDDPHIFAVSVLCCCKGISSATAGEVLKQCGGTLTDVWNTTEQQLAVLPISEKRKLGPAVAKKLFSLLHQQSKDALS